MRKTMRKDLREKDVEDQVLPNKIKAWQDKLQYQVIPHK
jgi:hypothetical protein